MARNNNGAQDKAENPFRRALANVGLLAKSAAPEVEDDEDVADDVLDDDDDELFAGANFANEDDGDASEDDDDDEEFDFSLPDDDDDASEDDDDDDDDEVEKSEQQSAAVTRAEAAAGKGKVKRALKVRAKNHAGEDEERDLRGKGFHRAADGDDDTDAEDDFSDDDGDEGDADASHGGDDFSPNTKLNNRRPGKRRYAKSVEEDDDADYGVPEAHEEFIEAVLASPYAKSIDSTEALHYLANLFGEHIARERAVVGIVDELAKSLESVAEMYDSLSEMQEKLTRQDYAANVMSTALTQILDSNAKILAQQETLAKSLEAVESGVELVKAQPAGTPMGVTPPPARQPAKETTQQGMKIRPHDVHVVLAEAVDRHEITRGQASDFMAMIDGQNGIEGVIKSLPLNVRNRLMKSES